MRSTNKSKKEEKKQKPKNTHIVVGQKGNQKKRFLKELLCPTLIVMICNLSFILFVFLKLFFSYLKKIVLTSYKLQLKAKGFFFLNS
jgi:hypothetical protein